MRPLELLMDKAERENKKYYARTLEGRGIWWYNCNAGGAYNYPVVTSPARDAHRHIYRLSRALAGHNIFYFREVRAILYSKMDTMRNLVTKLYGAIVSRKDGDYISGIFGYREPAQLKADVKLLKEFFDNGCKFKAPDRSWKC